MYRVRWFSILWELKSVELRTSFKIYQISTCLHRWFHWWIICQIHFLNARLIFIYLSRFDSPLRCSHRYRCHAIPLSGNLTLLLWWAISNATTSLTCPFLLIIFILLSLLFIFVFCFVILLFGFIIFWYFWLSQLSLARRGFFLNFIIVCRWSRWYINRLWIYFIGRYSCCWVTKQRFLSSRWHDNACIAAIFVMTLSQVITFFIVMRNQNVAR